MEKKSKIFVAGHKGMVGSAIVRKLLKEGFENLVLKTRQELDLLDQRAVKKFFEEEKPEYVIDSAARVGGIKANMENLADFLYENLEMQNNLMWQSHLNGVKKFLFLGSSCIYPRECPQPMKEEYFLTGKFEPTNEGYAVAKTAGIRLGEYLKEQHGKNFISCMPTNIYGENDNFDPNSSHVIPGIMLRMQEAKQKNLPEVVIWGTGESRREFLYVDDLAEAVYFLMQNYDGKQFVNVGTGEDISIKELAFAIKEVVGFEGNLVFDSTKPDGMPKKLLDVSKMKEMGWQYTTSFTDGLKKLYNYYLSTIKQ